MREEASSYFQNLQRNIISALEAVDGGGTFTLDKWSRKDDSGADGGGGQTCILQKGTIFEQAGVNFSQVHGNLPPEMAGRLLGKSTSAPFYATGTSLVIHPWSPLIPTTHANFRYLEVSDKIWFGGGIDLTPYYLFSEDAIHFHRTIKAACDRHDSTFYARYKKECDDYFFLPHRKEHRGIGGIFFDYVGKEDPSGLFQTFSFVKDVAETFLHAYLPIVEKHRNENYGEHERNWQLLRRGRYVEFNLLYDRGTLFGLKTNGRVESILMSLPPEVRWEYDFRVKEGSKEKELLEVVGKAREWV